MVFLEIFLGEFYAYNIVGVSDKLICVDDYAGVNAEVDISFLCIHTVVITQPLHHADEGIIESCLSSTGVAGGVYLNEACRSFDS